MTKVGDFPCTARFHVLVGGRPQNPRDDEHETHETVPELTHKTEADYIRIVFPQ